MLCRACSASAAAARSHIISLRRGGKRQRKPGGQDGGWCRGLHGVMLDIR